MISNQRGQNVDIDFTFKDETLKESMKEAVE